MVGRLNVGAKLALCCFGKYMEICPLFKKTHSDTCPHGETAFSRAGQQNQD
jgi:hypothetical protein